MESIILNLLNLTGEERAAFAVLAPQRFHPDGDGLTVEDWQSAQVILGNPPPECLRGSTALRWLHTRSAGVDPYTAPGVLPSEAALTCSTGAYGHSVSEHLFALLLALMKRLPNYRDQQNRALWRDLGPVKTLLGAQVLVVGTGDLGSSFARLCQTLGARLRGGGGGGCPGQARRGHRAHVRLRGAGYAAPRGGRGGPHAASNPRHRPPL